MSMTDGLPKAPMTWPPVPPRAPMPTWAWVLIAISTALVLTTLTFFGWGFLAYVNHDRLDFIEDSEIIQAIDEPCSAMHEAADDTPFLATDDPYALSAFTTVARRIPATVYEIDHDVLAGDNPAAGWADDWNALLDTLDIYAESLRTDVPIPFAMPLTEDGYSIVGRMNAAEPGGCAVPKELADLDSSGAALPEW